MNWVPFTEATVRADLSPETLAEEQRWAIDYNRPEALGEIVARTRTEFRDSIRTNPANRLTEDETLLPEACIRSALVIVEFSMHMEMGYPMPDQMKQAATRAEIFLRSIAYKHFSVTTDEAAPRPAYTDPAPRGLGGQY